MSSLAAAGIEMERRAVEIEEELDLCEDHWHLDPNCGTSGSLTFLEA